MHRQRRVVYGEEAAYGIVPAEPHPGVDRNDSALVDREGGRGWVIEAEVAEGHLVARDCDVIGGAAVADRVSVFDPVLNRASPLGYGKYASGS